METLRILSVLLLEILGEIAGGRGGAINDLPRFTLGLIIWSLLIISATNARRRSALLRDKLLIAGFVVAFSRDLFMLVVTLLGLHDIVDANTLALFLPPIDNTLMLIARAVIAAAFLHYFVNPSYVSKNFFILTLSVCILMHFVISYSWLTAVRANPALQFEQHWGVWFVHGFGAIFIFIAIVYFLQQKSWTRRIVAFTFTMYFTNHMLMLINLATESSFNSVFLIIRNNLDLWATPIFGFIYWRELRDKHAQLEAEMKQTERLELIGQLAAGVSHDFKNHLQVIRGYAELGQMQKSEPEKVEQCFSEISDTVERSVSLVNQLLTFSRPDKVESEDVVNVNDVVADLTPMLSQLLGPQYKLEFNLEPDLPDTSFDTTELEQVLVNLVVNARDALPDGGTIAFTTRCVYSAHTKSSKDIAVAEPPEVEFVQLVVTDGGMGMSKKTIRQAFEPFYTTKAVGEGTGLGLSTVYGLVSRHNGTIEIDSQLYSGTSVIVNLIPTYEDVEIEDEEDSLLDLGGTEHILVAEDDDSVRNLVYELLTRAGYTVYQAVDGKHAVELAQKHRHTIDLLLFDVAMPKLNGYLAYKSVSQILPNAPVAFVSADASRVKGNHASYPHLSKPFTRSELLSYIREQIV